MKRNTIAALLVAAVTAFVGAGAEAQPVDVDLYVNISSFGNEFGGISPQRVIEAATRSWLWGANAGVHYSFAGTTTDAGCSIGNSSHIFAESGCHPDDPDDFGSACITLADYYNCPFGGMRVRVWLGSTTFALGNPTASLHDFQTIIQHEIGHDWTSPHINTEGISGCVMGEGLGSRDVSRRGGYCRAEMNALIGDWDWDVMSLPVNLLSSPATADPGTSWSSISISPAITGGRGFVSFERAVFSIPDRLFFTDVTSTGTQRQSNYPTTGVSAISGAAQSQPTTAFDFTRNRSWRFYRTASSSTPNGVDFSVGTTSGTWGTPAAVLTGPSGPRIATRMPVGAAYDVYSDRIIVVYTDWVSEGSTLAGRLRYTSFPASGTGSWSSVVTFAGASSVGPPAIACEDSAHARNCSILHVGTDEWRRIWGINFGINTDGSLFSAEGIGTTGDYTDFPIGIAFSGIGKVSRMTAVFRGNDGKIRISRKVNAADKWPFSSAMPNSIGWGGPVVKRGSSNFHLMFTPP